MDTNERQTNRRWTRRRTRLWRASCRFTQMRRCQVERGLACEAALAA